MKYRVLIFSFFLFGCIIFICASISWSANKSSAEINVLLKDEQKELKILKNKIAQQEKLISSVGKKEGQLLGNLKKIDNQVKLKARELKIYKWNSLINKKKLAKLEKGLKKTQIELDGQKVSLGKRFRQIYKEGPVFPLKVAFSSESVSDLLQRIKYMDLIAEYDSNLLANFKSRLDDLNTEKKSLLAVKAKLVRLEKDAFDKQGEFQKARKNKKIFLKKIKKKKSLGIQTRKELLNASHNLNDLIKKILTKLVSGAGLDISDKKGRLSLPLKGKILNRFGRQKDKQLGSFIVHNGINIRSKTGMSVRSVFNGKVLYTGELEGYGNMIIIGHGKDYHSLYGHLDQINVKQNQIVQTGNIIGLSGDTGSLVGDTLYFEMRKNGKPIEPVRWFKIARRK
jgi:murein hydrolase activator